MVHAHVHPAGVGGDVVHAVGNRHLGVRTDREEAVVVDLDRVADLAPLPTGVGQLAEILLLLRIHADHRLSVRLMLLDLLIDVTELGIAIRVLCTLQRLDVGLQAEALLARQPTHCRRGDWMALGGQLFGQDPQGVGRPPQRRHRIAALVRLDQRQQRGQHLRIQVLHGLAATAGLASPTVGQRILSGFKLEDPRPDRRLGHSRSPRHRPKTAVSEQSSFLPHQQASLTLVQMRK